MLKINDDMLGRTPLIDYMLYLFQVTSEETYPTILEIPSEEWKPYIHILYSRSGQDDPIYVTGNYNLPTINVADDPSKVVLAFSGGKDSVAHAAFLVDQQINTTLYFVKRANRSYPNEYNVARKISNMLSTCFVEDELHYSGKVTRAESPVKNHLILSLIIDYMSHNNISRCACGTYLEDNLDKTSTHFGLSDAYEFYLAFQKAVQSFFPSFKWLCWFHSEVHALSYLVNYHPEFIPEYQSCLLPDRYRSNIKRLNEQKYNIQLLPNRCMSCWKCAQEYLILHLLHYHTIPDKLIHEQIYPQFRKDLAKVMAEERIPEDPASLSIPELVDCYITLDDIQLYQTKEGIASNIDFNQFK